MRTFPIGGDWTLSTFPEGALSIRTPDDLEQARDRGDPRLTTVPATVPGNGELDLVRAGLLPDPFLGANIHRLRPLEANEWWYTGSFETPNGCRGRRVEIAFRGVDCLATYWLNGERLGESANAMIEHRFEVTERLATTGANRLVVRLGSAVNEARRRPYDPSLRHLPTGYESLWIRKPAHAYGWDIMPRAVSAGIWRPVELVAHEREEIEELFITTVEADERNARLSARYRFATDRASLEGFSLLISGASGASTFSVERPLSFIVGDIGFEVPEPRLWWPRGYGEPSRYEVTAELRRGGRVVDTVRATIGIRTIELDRTDVTTDERPGRFVLRANGVPILAKGSNWVPADAFHSRDAERLPSILALADEVGCNILRCWGGNVYEDHAFFDHCDASGMLVWQDFAMACGRYPQQPAFLEAIRAEAESIVRKIRGHPSLAIWCGDNECDLALAEAGIDPGTNRITREVLPEVLRREDPTRPYLPSSPYYAPEAWEHRRTDWMPEQHLWGPRDYFKSRFYRESAAHFVSEIGYHGCPAVSSVRRFIEPEHLWPGRGDAQWIAHATDPLGPTGPFAYRIRLMFDQVRELFGLEPDSLESLALASQVSQAEANKFFVEMIRLGKWRRSGVIWWNLMDGWPQFSDAIVDYFGAKKLACHYLRRVQQPVCLMIAEPEGWEARVVVGNDSRRPAEGSYRVSDADTGEPLLAGAFSTGANENRALEAVRVSRGEQRLLVIEWQTEAGSFGNHYLLGSPPFSLDRYRSWLGTIAALEPRFDASRIAE